MLKRILGLLKSKLNQKDLTYNHINTPIPTNFQVLQEVRGMEAYIRIRIAKDIIHSTQFDKPGSPLDWSSHDRRYVDALEMATFGHTRNTLPSAIPVIWQIGIILLEKFGPHFQMLCTIISMAGAVCQTCVGIGHDRAYIESLYSSENPTSSAFKFWTKFEELDPDGKIKNEVINQLMKQ